jgi:transposase-like protein
LRPISTRNVSMNPSSMFCPHPDGPMRGEREKGNIVMHSQRERRYRCLVCSHTFSERKGTPYYRLRTEAEVVTLVVTLLAYGCPPRAIVAAFGYDERTVAAWQQRAGHHCEQMHRATVQQGRIDLEHVQADELWVKCVGRRLWLALAIAVPSRLWLGGVLGNAGTGT